MVAGTVVRGVDRVLVGGFSLSIALRLALNLPRDAATVPVVRRLLDQALRTLGVEPGCRDDIGLILTEACANVIEHALQIDDYEIGVQVTAERCVIHVVNSGALVDPARLSGGPAAAESSGSLAGAFSGPAASGPGAAAPFPVAPVRSFPGSPGAPGAGGGFGAAGVDAGFEPAADEFLSGGPAGRFEPAAGEFLPGGPAGQDAAFDPAAGEFLSGGVDGSDAGFTAAAGGGLAPGSPAGPGEGELPGPGADVLADAVFTPLLDEHGRGLHIIRSLADELYLTPSLSGGLVLQAVTALRWTADADLWQRR